MQVLRTDAGMWKRPNHLYWNIQIRLLPLLHGKSVDDAISELRTRGGLDEQLDYVQFFHLLESDIQKAVEFAQEKNLKYDYNISTLLRKIDLTGHWKECLQIIKTTNINRPQETRQLVMKILKQNPDDVEEIIKEIKPMALWYESTLNRQQIQAMLKEVGLQEKTSDPVMVSGEDNIQPDVIRSENDDTIQNRLRRACLRGRVREAEGLLIDLQKLGIDLGATEYRDLLVMYSRRTKNLSACLKYLTKLENEFPSFLEYGNPLIETCILMVEKDKFCDVMPHLTLFMDRCEEQGVEPKKNVVELWERLGTSIGHMVDPKEGLEFVDKMVEISILPGQLVNHVKSAVIKGCVQRGDQDLILKALGELSTRKSRKMKMSFMDIMSYFIIKEDSAGLQKVVNEVQELFNETETFMLLLVGLVLNNKMPQAQELAQTPGLVVDNVFLGFVCRRLIQDEKIEELKRLVDSTKDLFLCDRKSMLFSLMKGYLSVKNYKSAREVLLMYDEEGVVPTVETLQYLADQLKSNGEVVDFVVPSVKHSEPKENVQTSQTTDKKKKRRNRKKKAAKETAALENEQQQEDNEETKQMTNKSYQQVVTSVLKEKGVTKSFVDFIKNKGEYDTDFRLSVCTEVHQRTNPGEFKKFMKGLAVNGDTDTLVFIKDNFNTETADEMILISEAHSEPVKLIEKLESLEAQDLDQHVSLDILNKLHNSLPEKFEKVVDIVMRNSSVGSKSFHCLWEQLILSDPEKANSMIQTLSEDEQNKMIQSMDIPLLAVKARVEQRLDVLYKLLDIAKKTGRSDAVQQTYGNIIHYYAHANDVEKMKEQVNAYIKEGFSYRKLHRNTRRVVREAYNQENVSNNNSTEIQKDNSSNQEPVSSSTV